MGGIQKAETNDRANFADAVEEEATRLVLAGLARRAGLSMCAACEGRHVAKRLKKRIPALSV